ncbi:MAG TPA: hypothetical protein VFG83_18885 [Kofleriaceae bacterium]|nr:hypothetical protein [Kofleriaceae bacterium]
MAALVVAMPQAIAQKAAPAAAAAGAQSDLLAKAGDIAKKVSTLRGLSIVHPIKRGVMTRAEIQKRLVANIDEEYKPGELAAEAVAMKRLGLLPADADYKKLVLDILTEQIAGFYDPKAKELYIASWSTTGCDMVMAHEIDHALQDQHFNLEQLIQSSHDNGDVSLARQALAEGDGMVLMIEYLMAKMGQPPPWGNPLFAKMIEERMQGTEMAGMSKLAGAPRVLRETLIFPYVAGMAFVIQFRKHHPWKRIDAVYRKPPLSTEHILHPETYKRYERPDRVRVRPLRSLRGYDKIYDNITGELGFRIFLRERGVSEDTANIAAGGWGGDRVAMFAPAGHKPDQVDGVIGVSYSVWDAGVDAQEMFEAESSALRNLVKGGTEVASTASRLVLGAGDLVWMVERKGDRVVAIFAAPKAKGDAILGDVWKHWQVRRSR